MKNMKKIKLYPLVAALIGLSMLAYGCAAAAGAAAGAGTYGWSAGKLTFNTPNGVEPTHDAVLSAFKQYRWQDNLTRFAATLGVALPNYVIAALLIYFVGVKAGWLPVARWGSWQQAIMPAIALAGFPTAFIARLVRSSVLEVLQQDYIRTAKAKGLPGRVVLYRHALRNALIPVVTYLGPLIAGIFTGSFVIERMFAIPGLGDAFVTSITNRDYTLILGATVFYSVLLLAMNFVVDVAYVFIDPRIKLADERS